MERFLPSPFSKNRQSNDSHKVVRDPLEVEGLFECYTCYEGVRSAMYNPQKKMLTWTCSQGHDNEERNVEVNV